MRSVKPSAYFPLLTFLLILAGCTSPRPVLREQLSPAPPASGWAGQTLRSMTLEEKIGQMIMSRTYGYFYGHASDEYRKTEHLVKDLHIGGLAYFQGDVLETAAMIERMQKLAAVPLLTAGDFEWGSAMRLRRGTRFPEAMALGATRDTALAYQEGAATADELRVLGIRWCFAPVADVNLNPQNPVINTRSYGEQPALVAAMAAAYASGVQSRGVLATGKHFPGHGDTDVDSHLSLPVVTHSRGRLDSIDLVPYREMIRRDLAAVMVAHLELPALDPHVSIPATLSENAVTGLLRRDLGFTGLVVSDAMDMGALVNSFNPDSAAVKAIQAGVDVLLLPPDEETVIGVLADAVRTGKISEERIDRSVRRILEVKERLGLPRRTPFSPDSVSDVVESPEHLALAKEIARKSITVVRDGGILPLSRFSRGRILNVVVADAENYRTEINRPTNPWSNEPVGDYFTAQLRRRMTNFTTYHLDPSSNEIDSRNLWQAAGKADLILCTVFSKARSGSGQFGLPPQLAGMIDSLTLHNKKTCFIAMGSPYILSGFPRFDAYLCTYSDAEVSTEAAVEALCGEIPVGGKLPVTIPGIAAYGDGVELRQTALRKDSPEAAGFRRDSLARIDTIIQKAIRDSAFPGAQVLVGRNGAIVFNKAFGTLEYGAKSPAVNAATIYDLASLTKVIATTSAVMRLYDEGKLRLDDRLVDILPQCDNHGKQRITIRNLLLHNGGLPPFKRLYLTCTTARQALDSVYQTEMIYPTGDSTVYSDFDFILLGKIIEKITGVSLDRYVDSVFFGPLGMTRTMYRPPMSMWDNVAPSELDTIVRKGIVRGTVHDENAYLLGGVSGHAGLFSTASDLAILVQMLMNGGTYGHREYLRPETVKLFTTRQAGADTRALGWDTKTMNGYSSAGSLFSGISFGHTGFTGTSVWADPTKNLFVIFLTNRVYPTRANEKIRSVRPAVHDAVMKALLPVISEK